jgi:hypothetical protein
MDWKKILRPCPITPIDKTWCIIEVPKRLNPREKIISVMKKWGIPHAFIINNKHLLSCRIHVIFEDTDDKVKIYFTMDPKENKAMESIELGLMLLREAGLINNETEKQAREELMNHWNFWVTKYAPILPKLWELLLAIDANND